MNDPVIIIGAGLSGLRTASLLAAQGIECRVLEARDRIGGRALSTSVADRPELGPFDLGPTWFWPQYEHAMPHLVEELNVETFVQHTKGNILLERSANRPPERFVLPENPAQRSVRFVGGVQSLIEAIADTIPSGTIELETQVTAIRRMRQVRSPLKQTKRMEKRKRLQQVLLS